MTPLDYQEMAVLKFIAEYQRDKGLSPSVREIAAACTIRSTSVIVEILDELESRTFISRTPGKKRAITVHRVPNYCRCPDCGALTEEKKL